MRLRFIQYLPLLVSYQIRAMHRVSSVIQKFEEFLYWNFGYCYAFLATRTREKKTRFSDPKEGRSTNISHVIVMQPSTHHDNGTASKFSSAIASPSVIKGSSPGKLEKFKKKRRDSSSSQSSSGSSHRKKQHKKHKKSSKHSKKSSKKRDRSNSRERSRRSDRKSIESKSSVKSSAESHSRRSRSRSRDRHRRRY